MLQETALSRRFFTLISNITHRNARMRIPVKVFCFARRLKLFSKSLRGLVQRPKVLTLTLVLTLP